MNTMTTLFSGLAGVFVLYALGGAIRSLPPMLRALLSGIIPLLAYFLLIVGRWPGLDVVAMHISVFLAAALVLFALTQLRRRGATAGGMHWAPKLLVAFFMALVVVNGTLLYIATKGLPDPIGRWWLGSDGGAVYSGFSGVVDHGQGAAKAVSAELSQSYRESKLGWQVDLSGLDGSEVTRQVEVRVRDRTGLPVNRVEAGVSLQRLGATAPAVILPLSRVEAGVYIGSLSLPAAGRWLAKLNLIQDGVVHYQSTQELVLP